MKSPFPGMDPYLEQRWSDVHGSLITFLKEAIQAGLPRDLRARSEERLVLETEEADQSAWRRPDIAVVSGGYRAEGSATGLLTYPEAILVEYEPAPDTERWVQIIDTANGDRVVTVIEVLSPWNKAAGKLNRSYRKKLNDFIKAGVSVVEIDLLRTPDRQNLVVEMSHLPAERRAEYMVCVWDARKPIGWMVYPMKLRESLPNIPIPLRKTDPVVGLALQPLIERVYVAGGHDDLPYEKPLRGELRASERAWVEEVLQQAGYAPQKEGG